MPSLLATRARKRPWYIVAIFGVIALGLASRHFPTLFPDTLGKYPGDVLWALMVFLGWGIIFPKHSTFYILIYTLITSDGVEFCKFYDTAWIVNFRHTTPGHLILGSVFSWKNLVAYTIGAIVGVLSECTIVKNQ
jgi:hypothetical protein